jgi:hypothetical protein
MGLILLLMALSEPANTVDLDALCRGWCMQRFDDGFNRGDYCACVTYEPIPGGKIRMPKRNRNSYSLPVQD